MERTLIWITGDQQAIHNALQAELRDKLRAKLDTKETAMSSRRSAGLKERNYVAGAPQQPITPHRLWLGTDIDKLASKLDIPSIPTNNAIRYLGEEFQTIVFNAIPAFDANAFAAICGTLVHGGHLYLLTPPLHAWTGEDPENPDRDLSATPLSLTNVGTQNHTVGNGPELVTNLIKGDSDTNFIKRLATILGACTRPLPPAVVNSDPADQPRAIVRQLYRENPARASDRPEDNSAMSFLPVLAPENASDSCGSDSSDATPEQQTLIDELLHQFEYCKAKTWIITADRGRGKSALLGMLLAQLHARLDTEVSAQSPPRPIIHVTGPARRATRILFDYYHRNLGEATTRSAIEFQPPDRLIQQAGHGSLLCIDEAAALPLPVLKKLLMQYDQVILATTVHGYEGAGRGFAIRLRNWLQDQNHQQQWFELEQPIRWLPGDPLERFCNHAFLLKSELPQLPSETDHDGLHLREVTQQELLDDETLLQRCFALLLQAHYQTRPVDLRHLLDGANLKLFVLQTDNTIIAIAWIAIEGPFAGNELRDAIVRKKRRPSGHLLPQLLSQWLAKPDVLDHTIGRVVRVAVHPILQRKGLGSQILQQLEQRIESTLPEVKAMGAIFGADEGLVGFWKRSGYRPFHLGQRKNNRSGERSIAMLKPIGQDNLSTNKSRPISDWIETAIWLYCYNFKQDLQGHPGFYPDHLSHINGLSDASLANAVSSDCVGMADEHSATTFQPLVDPNDLVMAYIREERSFADSKAFIAQTIAAKLGGQQGSKLSAREVHLLGACTEAAFSFATYAKAAQVAQVAQATQEAAHTANTAQAAQSTHSAQRVDAQAPSGKSQTEKILRTALNKLISA